MAEANTKYSAARLLRRVDSYQKGSGPQYMCSERNLCDYVPYMLFSTYGDEKIVYLNIRKM